MPTSSAHATWEGALKDGQGSVALGSGAYEGPYSFASRFGDGDDTNPEELIGAAEAGCYAMAFANMLDEEGYSPESVHAEAVVTLDAEALEITTVDLTVEATVPDIDEDAFQELADQAKEGCPVSKVLAGADITLDASLA
ncbi:peroxiredoxin [Halobacteriales archaeon SW_10_68_16]|jgi:osmotically inducible protein OsmC|nr:MAG: peroxiredoxin [Halobacteriales archaeon SW_10_68_16]